MANSTAERAFSRGAVVKLVLHNFLTFDDVVIYPQPQLNVIVGPNGTGKSSIVCALCLGLGGHTTLLGRAKEVSDFVKHGKETGFVEITLHDERLRTNPVIRRTLVAGHNRSTWTINRVEKREADVKKVVESLNIQLGNRCMFLPQDKVVEFARMNKQELLVETERAVGAKDLHKTHERLISLKSDYSQTCDSLKNKKAELENLERKNKLLERDVERYKNRQNYLRDIKHLTFKKFWVQYDDARGEFDKRKKERKKASEELKRIKEHYQPIKEKHRVQEEEVNRYKTKDQNAMKAVQQTEKVVRDFKEKLASLEDKLEEPRQDLENTKKQEANRKNKIEIFQREIEGFRKAMEDLEPAESLTPKIAQKNVLIREIQTKQGTIADRQRELYLEKQEYEDVLRREEEQLHLMNNVWTQRLQKLEKRDPATTQVIKWLRNNQDKFSKPILEPVCMSLNVVDPQYTKQVEAFFSGRDFASFIAQTEEDREKFLREVRDNMNLKVNIVRAPDLKLDEYTPAIPFNRLQQHNFKKMLLSVVEAPEPVLCYFCRYHGLHHIPIAGNLRPEEIDHITSQLPNLVSFFTADMRYSVKRSLYRNATSTRSSDLYPPRFLVTSVDVQKRDNLMQKIRQAKDTLSGYVKHLHDLDAQDQELRKEDAKIRSEKQKLREVLDSWKSHRTNITTRERKLEQCLATDYNIEEAEKKCEREVGQIQTERVRCILKLVESAKSVLICTDKSVKAFLDLRAAETRVGFFLRKFREAKTAYDDAEQKVKVLTDIETQSKERASTFLKLARKETGVNKPEDKPELLSNFQMYPEKLEEIDDRIHELKAQADACTTSNDRQVIDEFKSRERKIEKLNKEIDTVESDIGGRDDSIKELKEKWLSPLKEVIHKINVRFRTYFSSHTQMECAGEISLDPDPGAREDFSDFDKVGVQIKVKFRATETLQELNAQRQSGGERSVSTMLYLMALQGYTACPFRVVDEINQGMDPVNERHIFNLIVQSAHQGAQYFLLTPKLLQNLEYSDAVCVHIVNNGQEMLSCDQWQMDQFLS